MLTQRPPTGNPIIGALPLEVKEVEMADQSRGDGGAIERGAKLAPLDQFIAPDAIFDPRFNGDPFNLSVYDRLVYLYLCRRRSKENVAFPSYRRIAEDCGMSKRKAQDCVQNLVRVGLVKKRERLNGNQHATNLYMLVEPKAVLEAATNASRPSAPHAPGVEHDVHHPSAPGAPPLEHDVHHPSAPGAPEGSTDEGFTDEGFTVKEYSAAVRRAIEVGQKGERKQLLAKLKKIAKRLPETDPPKKPGTWPATWQSVCMWAVDLLRGSLNTRTGYGEIAKYAKEAFSSGYTPAQWIECAETLFKLREAGETWVGRVSPALVNKYLPEHVAGKLSVRRRKRSGTRPANVSREEDDLNQVLAELRRQS